jgi:hypothetical protein
MGELSWLYIARYVFCMRNRSFCFDRVNVVLLALSGILGGLRNAMDPISVCHGCWMGLPSVSDNHGGCSSVLFPGIPRDCEILFLPTILNLKH